jgi:hypothetical protein
MESKFASALKNLRIVATGIKASNDTEPTLTLLGIPNKFQLNRLATALMGLKVGDRIRIIAAESDDINTKFYIAKTADTDATGAKISKANSQNPAKEGIDMTFNYSGIWGILLQGEASAVELGYEALIAKGLVIAGVTKGGGNDKYRSTVNVKLTLESVGKYPIDGVEFDLFALTAYAKTEKSDEELAEVVSPKDSSNVDAPKDSEAIEDSEAPEDEDENEEDEDENA